MAENALYISSVENVKPSIFELVAQESLMGTLHPSFNLLCNVLKNKFNEKLRCFFKYQEEWFLIFNFVLQFHYMRLFKGSFSEAFYGLKRVPLRGKSNKLSRYSKILTFFCLIGLPYVSIKVKRMIESYQLKVLQSSDISIDKKKRVEQVILAYKSVNTLYEVVKLCCLISYTSGLSEYHSPLLKICDVKLVYHNIQVPSWRDLITDYFKNKKRISTVVIPITVKLFSQILEVSAFTVQFLNWWHSDEIKTKLNTLPTPPPLQVISNNKMLCPICNCKRKVEVVLQSSGYAYCYRCIRDELLRTGKCPVTNLPATTEHLIRIYTDS